MNDNLTALLDKLATKLGTTTEYLWKVLLVQAKISATNSLIFLVMAVVSGIILYRIHKRLAKPIPGKSYNNSRYEEDGELYIPIMIMAACIWVICSFFIITDITNIINGYFNPEYWALKEILNSI